MSAVSALHVETNQTNMDYFTQVFRLVTPIYSILDAAFCFLVKNGTSLIYQIPKCRASPSSSVLPKSKDDGDVDTTVGPATVASTVIAREEAMAGRVTEASDNAKAVAVIAEVRLCGIVMTFVIR